MLYALIVVSILLPILSFLSYLYGKKIANQAFMEMLFRFGYGTKVEAFKTLNQYHSDGGIVFVGDSITQDFNVYEYFKGKDVYNRGIGGDTSQGVLKRLKESVFDLNPKKVFIHIGTNDFELLDATPQDVFERTKEIVQSIHAYSKDIEIYVMSIYPVNPMLDPLTVGKRTNEKIMETNQLNSGIESVTYVNIYDKLVLDQVLHPSYTLEGLHLNQKGYEAVKKVLNEYI